jgi:hypothetical protein
MGVLLSVAESDSTVNANSQDIYVKAVFLVLAPEGSLPCCSVSLVKRDCNVMAQELGNLARVQRMVGPWDCHVPAKVLPNSFRTVVSSYQLTDQLNLF